MPSQDSAHPTPSPGTPGADSGGPRFTDAFARRPAAPRRRLLPEKRVRTTVAGAAVVTAVVALAVPAVGRVTFVADEPAAHVAAVDPAPLPSRTGATPAQPAPGGSGAPSGAAAPDAPQAQGVPAPAAPPAAGKAPGGSDAQAPGTPAQPKPQQSQQPTKKAAPDPAPVGSMIVGTGSDRCIDIPGGNPLDGLQLQIHDCDGRAPQRWKFRGDGTVRAMGLCMDVAWGSRNDGAAIQLAQCSGNPAQRFVMSDAGDLVNLQANKCVDVKDQSTGDGTKLQLWTCSGFSNQKWRLA